MVIHFGAVGFIKDIDIETGIVARLFKEELNNPFAGKTIHHLRQFDVVSLNLDRQAMQFVVRNGTVEFDSVFQLLHRNVQTFKEQTPGLPGDAQRFKATGFLTGTGETQVDTFGDQLLHAGTDQAAQMLAVAEHLDAVRWRRILVHLAENGFQRFDHRLLAVEVQGTHLIPRVAVQQINTAHQAVLLLAKAEHVQLTEIKMHHLIAERRRRVVFQVDDNRQMANFARTVECFWRRRRQTQREVVRHIGHHFLQFSEIDNLVAFNKQAGT